MKKTAAIIALAGMAAIASAQSATVALTHDDGDNEIGHGDTVTWTLSVAFTGGAAATGGNMSIAGAGLGTSSDMTYTPVNGGNNGGLSNGDGIGFVSWTNSILIAQFDPLKPFDASNPFVVGTFTYTAGNVDGAAGLGLSIGLAASAFVSVGANAFSDIAINLGDANLTVSVQDLNIVPTPASAALLGLGGLVAIRRRR